MQDKGNNTMDTNSVGVGVIGCGNISSIYLKNLTSFAHLRVLACADLDLARAKAQAAAYGVPRACTPDQLLADDAIELVVNLTIPAAHAAVAAACIDAGKSVYNEKPLAVARPDGERLLAAARVRGVRVGAAPDTFLGAGLQTCRALIDAGAIGEPVAATAFMLGHGPEGWHPNPQFFYAEGAGPLFDMGPYYLTTLIALLGPVARVSGAARISFPTRTISSQPFAGETIQVAVPTHVAATLEMVRGPIATLITSFDVWHSQLPRIEVYGSLGTIVVPDPNTFGGPVLLRRAADEAWHEQPLEHGYGENSRGLGVADMALALREGRPHRASGEMAYHVLDLMHAIYESAESGRHIAPTSQCAQPEALPVRWP
jgi:predicted dehydrogenase